MCRLIFDAKMNIISKYCCVSGGNLMYPPSSMTYSIVFILDSFRSAFLFHYLSYLDILTVGIQNAYINAPMEDKFHFYAGDKCKSDRDKMVLIFWALCVLNSLALVWRNHLTYIIGNRPRFRSSLADPDVWYKTATGETGFEYSTYIIFLC